MSKKIDKRRMEELRKKVGERESHEEAGERERVSRGSW